MAFTTGQNDLLQMSEQHFDFNIQFEQLLFSIIPSTLFIITSLWRTVSQTSRPTIVNAPLLQFIKLSAILSYVGLELALLILVAIGSIQVTNIFRASAALRLVAAIFMIAPSVVDHSKSPRPSILLTCYLFLTLLLDIAQARTLFILSGAHPETTYSAVFTASVGIKACLLLIELQHKSRWITWDINEHSPEETSNIFSLGVLFWLNQLFLDGYRKCLTPGDLYPLDVSLRSRQLHARFSKNIDYDKLQGHKFGLLKALAKTLAVPFMLPVFPRLMLLGFTFCQPFFIEKLLDHLARPEIAPNVGYGFIGASLLIYSGMAISGALCMYFHHRMRAMTRAILVTEIFDRATKARIGHDDHNAALTLMSTDIERIKLGLRMVHNVWAGFIQAALAAWMLYIRLGVIFSAPIILIFVCFALLGVLVHFTGDSQRAWMAAAQKRVGLTATVISSMKNLKISGLSSTIGEYVQMLRVEELAAGARFRKIFIMAALFGFTPMLISPPVILAFTRENLDATRVFTSLSFLMLLTNPLSQIFQAIPEIVSGVACVGRIQAFLECETRHDFRQVLDKRSQSGEKVHLNTDDDLEFEHSRSTVIDIKGGSFGWEEDKPALQNINVRIAKSSFTMIVGQVGSGKSTFCKALLGEIPFSKGSVTMESYLPHVGFCDQSAFLWNGSIRENITGFLPFNDILYSKVIHATALDVDFSTFPQGDQVIVGSDGIALSGGQKQRVSLARALYLQPDLLILDDVFSGLDADTERQVFQRVFGPSGLLRQRHATVVLCTHSVRYLPMADHIVTLGDGGVIEQGDYEALIANQGYVYGLRLIDSSDSDAATIDEATATSTPGSQCKLPGTTIDVTAAPADDKDQARRFGDKSVYRHYFKSMGMSVTASCLFLAVLWGFFTNFPTIWLKYWTDDIASGQQKHSNAYHVGIYALLQVCGLISLLLLGIVLFIVAVKRAGANLHRNTIQTLIRAPLHFFIKTDTGVITNLFSQDLNLIDTELPDALLNTLFCASQATGQAAVMLTSSPYLAISYPFLAALLYAVQRFYLRTSRQLRLLDLEAKSPLYTHFLDTFRGITSLRAFGFIADDITKNARLLDSSQKPAYLLAMVQEWLNVTLDLVVMLIAVILTALAVRLQSSAGFTGASLVSLMAFGENISGIIIFYTKLETSIGAITRLKNFQDDVKPEDTENEDALPPESWPQTGAIEFKGVSASYDVEHQDKELMNLALRGIHLVTQPGEKVAICGRTGSGKSSLIALLLKLLDPLPGTEEQDAVIDGLPLSRIKRSALRQHIIAVPQEAVFLPDGSTFKTNLDPSGESTADECESILSIVGLWDFVQERGGLEIGMVAGTLSAGQRQLMSLGRAVLRRRIRAQKNARVFGDDGEGGILVLDEVNSSIDRDTEHAIKDIINTEFKSYTVIAVCHRLDMVMEFDKVIVMDRGEIVEVGNPSALAATAGTRFECLVKAGGK